MSQPCIPPYAHVSTSYSLILLLFNLVFHISHVSILYLSTFLAVYWDEGTKLGGGTAMKGCGWGPAGAVWVWCLIWFLIIEFCKVFTNGLYDHTDSVGDLFMSPLTRKFLRSFIRKDKSGSGRGRSATIDKNVDSATPFVNALRGEDTSENAAEAQERRQIEASVAAAIDASTMSDAPRQLLKMPSLGPDSNVKDVIKVVNAMRQHIYNLESRLRDIDGVHVTENAKSSPNLKSLEN